MRKANKWQIEQEKIDYLLRQKALTEWKPGQPTEAILQRSSVLSLDLVSDNTAMLETNFATGRNRKSAPEVGADFAQVTFTTPIQGLVSAAGDGTAASSVADDWLDLLLTNVFGAPQETTGEGIDASATASSLVTDSDAFTNQDMVAVQGRALTAARSTGGG